MVSILDRMRRLFVPALVFLAAAAVPSMTAPQGHPDAAEISADLGPCSALITVTDADGKPVYGAKMTARVQYGFAGVKKLDLEAYTGVDGKVKIAKLPESLKKPMVIHIGKGDKADQVEFKPNVHCHATFDVQLK